ncbi:MAG: NADH-quinone oxidoreductase subunit J [Candidatus Dasytiphilus stammeri]
MKFIFYICGTVAVVSTLRVITHNNIVHALLYLIIFVLSLSGVFFSLGASFAGALEVIVYAGAILVLFVLVVIMLNLNQLQSNKRYGFQASLLWLAPCILLSSLLLYSIHYSIPINYVSGYIVNAKDVGRLLFGSYMLVMELASMLLLAAMIVAFHIGHKYR